MKNTQVSLLIISLSIAVPATAQQPSWWPTPQAGNWQSTMQIQGKTFSTEGCLSEQDIKSAKNQDEATLGGEGCTPGTYSRQASNVFIANFSCKNASYIVKQTQASKDSYDVETTTLGKNKPPQIMKVSLKFLGTCKASNSGQDDIAKALSRIKQIKHQ
jgi:hypothetical protein